VAAESHSIDFGFLTRYKQTHYNGDCT